MPGTLVFAFLNPKKLFQCYSNRENQRTRHLVYYAHLLFPLAMSKWDGIYLSVTCLLIVFRYHVALQVSVQNNRMNGHHGVLEVRAECGITPSIMWPWWGFVLMISIRFSLICFKLFLKSYFLHPGLQVLYPSNATWFRYNCGNRFTCFENCL